MSSTGLSTMRARKVPTPTKSARTSNSMNFSAMLSHDQHVRSALPMDVSSTVNKLVSELTPPSITLPNQGSKLIQKLIKERKDSSSSTDSAGPSSSPEAQSRSPTLSPGTALASVLQPAASPAASEESTATTDDENPTYLARKVIQQLDWRADNFVVPGKMPRHGKLNRKKDGTEAPNWAYAMYTILAHLTTSKATVKVLFETCTIIWPSLLKADHDTNKRPNQTAAAVLAKEQGEWCYPVWKVDEQGNYKLNIKGERQHSGKWRLMNKTGEEPIPKKGSKSKSSNSSASDLPPVETKAQGKGKKQKKELNVEERKVEEPGAKRARTESGYTAVPNPDELAQPASLTPFTVGKAARVPIVNKRTPGIGKRSPRSSTSPSVEQAITAPVAPEQNGVAVPTAPIAHKEDAPTAPTVYMYDAEDIRTDGRGMATKKIKAEKTAKPTAAKDARTPSLDSPYYDTNGQCGLTNDQFFMFQAWYEVNARDPYMIRANEQKLIEIAARNGKEHFTVSELNPKEPSSLQHVRALDRESKKALGEAFLNGSLKMTMESIQKAPFKFGPIFQKNYDDKINRPQTLV